GRARSGADLPALGANARRPAEPRSALRRGGGAARQDGERRDELGAAVKTRREWAAADHRRFGRHRARSAAEHDLRSQLPESRAAAAPAVILSLPRNSVSLPRNLVSFPRKRESST